MLMMIFKIMWLFVMGVVCFLLCILAIDLSISIIGEWIENWKDWREEREENKKD